MQLQHFFFFYYGIKPTKHNWELQLYTDNRISEESGALAIEVSLKREGKWLLGEKRENVWDFGK